MPVIESAVGEHYHRRDPGWRDGQNSIVRARLRQRGLLAAVLPEYEALSPAGAA